MSRSSVPRDERPRPVVRALGVVILACLFLGVVLTSDRRGPALWEGARILFIPGGLLMMLQSTLLGRRRAHPMIAIRPNWMLAPGLFIFGFGFAAYGTEYVDPGRDWSVLTAPGLLLLGFLCLREAFLGPRGPVIGLMESSAGRLGMRLAMPFLAAMCATFGLEAAGLIDL